MVTLLEAEAVKSIVNPSGQPHRGNWPRRSFNLLKHGLVFWPVALGHFLLTCLFTYPLIFRVTDSLPGLLLEDRDQNIWNLWWVRYSLLHLKNPFHTDYIYYPDGVSLYFHTLNFMNGLLSLPVQFVFGTTLAYNFVVFFSFVAGGIGAYLLLKYLCGHRAAAFVGSMVFAYSPYHLGTLKGLLQLISLEWLPFYVLFLLLATRETNHKIRNSGLAAFFLICTGLTDWYYTLFLLMFTVLYAGWGLTRPVWNWFRQHRNPWPALKSLVWPLLGILGLFGLALAPILLPMLNELGSTDYYLPSNNAATDFSANLAAFFVPPTTSSLLGGLARNFPAEYLTGPLAAQVYLGYVALILAGIGLVFCRRARFWGVTFLIFWLLSLGPRLQINGDSPGWPMPFALIQNFPIIKVSRSPDRFMVIAMLALAVCVAFGLSFLLSRLGHNPANVQKSQEIFRLKRNVWLAGGAGLLIVLEFLQIPYPVNTIETSQFWQQLAQDQDDYAIIELPPQGGFWSGGPRMAAQAGHHKRIFDGYISREFDHPFYRDTPGFGQLAALRDVPEVFTPLPTGIATLPGQHSWYDAFNYYKVHYIVIDYPQTQKQRDTFDLAQNRAAVYQVVGLNAPPIYQDKFLEAYELPVIADPQPFLQIGDGWYAPETDANGLGVHRWAKGAATLNALWVGPGSHTVTLSLKLGLLSKPQPLTVSLNGQPIYSGVLSGPPQTIEVSLTLPTGASQLNFTVAGVAQTPLSLGMGGDTRLLLFFIDQVSLK